MIAIFYLTALLTLILKTAALEEKKDIVELLVDNEADIFHTDNDGDTALIAGMYLHYYYAVITNAQYNFLENSLLYFKILLDLNSIIT